MTLRTEPTPDGIFRAYDPDDPSIEGFGATRREAKADAGQALEPELTPVLDSGLPAVPGTEPSPEIESEKQAAVQRFEYEKTADGWVYYDPMAPDKKYPEPPAEEQVGCLAEKYLPVADRLLAKHGLEVPEYVRAMLAKTITNMRELEAVKTVEVMEQVKALNCVGIVDGKPQVEIIEVERPVRVEAPKEARSPIPGLKSAQKHIAKLLEYAEKPPAHKGRVAARCANLRAALLKAGSYGAFELAMEASGDGTDYGKLLDALEKGYVLEVIHLNPSQRRDLEAQRDRLLQEVKARDSELGRLKAVDRDRWAVEAERWGNERDGILETCDETRDTLEVDWGGVEELRKWLGRIDRILARGEDWRNGQPPALTRRIVKDGCIAWRAAGREPEYSYHCVGGRWAIYGPLPDFLRDLIACCNGTHECVKKPPRRVPQGYRLQEFPKRGDGITLSHEALQRAIVQYWA